MFRAFELMQKDSKFGSISWEFRPENSFYSFRVGVSVGGQKGEMVLHEKLTTNGILHGLKLRRLTQNRINPHSKSSQNHRTVKLSNEAHFQKKTPTHICVTYAITNFYQNF